MALEIGTRLGSYEIQAAIGAGGMGEVYRARDTRLHRDVAIKVLPDAFAADPERLARFEREAQVLASLNHPNIAAIHGVEESAVVGAGVSRPVRALVLEFVDGPTLADRIAQGPLPLDEALPIARQIAEALDAAHERGIVHRDLKPANIKLRPDGTVKVLDFGLAKALETAPAATGASLAPTVTSPVLLTGIGAILGTAAYMAPEQAKGHAADKRSDVWAFACVLYEMCTGRRAFQGEDVADVLAAVLSKEPDHTAMPREAPEPLRRLLRRCFTKNRRDRLADMVSARLEIEDALHELTTPSAPSRNHALSRLGAVVIGVAALVAGASVAGVSVWVTTRDDGAPVERFSIAESGTAAIAVNVNYRDLAITPDGSRIVYAGNNARQLFVRAVGQLDPIPLAAGPAGNIFIAPDGQSVGFVENASVLKTVAMTGGPSTTVTPLKGFPRGAVWLPDDTVVFATGDIATGLQRVPVRGGPVSVLTKPDTARGEIDHLFPEALPGGRAILFTITRSSGLDDAQVAVLDLQTGNRTVILSGGSHAHYMETGHLVYVAGESLRAVPFDVDRLEVQGTPTPVVSRLVTFLTGGGDFDIARNGTLTYVDAPELSPTAPSTLTWVDREGREESTGAPPRAYVYPRISPDGTRVASSSLEQTQDIWLWDLVRQTGARITSSSGGDSWPLWTPDAKQIVFTSRDGIRRVSADGTGNSELLTGVASNLQATGVSPDGAHVVFHQQTATRRDLMLLTLSAADRPVRTLLQTPFDERNGVISPDGRWLAYDSDVSGGGYEIYVRPFPAVSSGQWTISTSGGTRPVWSRRGDELFYLADDASIMSARIETSTAPDGSWQLSGGRPVRVAQGVPPLGVGSVGRNYDVSPDGRRFLVAKRAQRSDSKPPHVVVVRNWHEELKRLVPVN